MKNYKNQSPEIYSFEIQEIVSKVPNIIVRLGNSVFFIIMFLIIIISGFIKYPDIIIVPFQLTSANTPKPVSVKNNSRLIKLLIHENDKVQKNEILAYLESTADHASVILLEAELDTLYKIIMTTNEGAISQLQEMNFSNLGEIQSEFKLFNQAYIQFLSLFSNRYYQKRRNFLVEDLEYLKKIHSNLKNQAELLEKDSELALQEFLAQKKLAEEKVIAPLELKKEESKYLSKRIPLLQLHTQIIDNTVKQSNIQKELLELDKVIAEHKTNIVQSIEILKSRIDLWKSQHLITSPLSGKILFSDFLQENQIVREGQELFFIKNSTSEQLGMIKIPQNNFGKVKKGQKVLIKFDGYPFQEFGLVEGKIDFISEIPLNDNTFLAKILLPKGLITSYNKELLFKQGMTASAEVITNDKRLIEKFVIRLREAIN